MNDYLKATSVSLTIAENVWAPQIGDMYQASNYPADGLYKVKDTMPNSVNEGYVAVDKASNCVFYICDIPTGERIFRNQPHAPIGLGIMEQLASTMSRIVDMQESTNRELMNIHNDTSRIPWR